MVRLDWWPLEAALALGSWLLLAMIMVAPTAVRSASAAAVATAAVAPATAAIAPAAPVVVPATAAVARATAAVTGVSCSIATAGIGRATKPAKHESGFTPADPGEGGGQPVLVDDAPSDDDDSDDDGLQPASLTCELPRALPPANGVSPLLPVSALPSRDHRRPIERPPTA